MKETQDNIKVCATVLTDLWKAFDCLFHVLLIAKLHTFGLDVKSLRVIHAYLNDNTQVTKVNSFFTEILQISDGVSQGSILGPLLLNVSLTDLFLAEHYKSDFSNYADDTTPYNRRSTFLKTISDLEITLDNLFNWFCYNNFKANASTCHLLLSPFNAKSININVLALQFISTYFRKTCKWAL